MYDVDNMQICSFSVTECDLTEGKEKRYTYISVAIHGTMSYTTISLDTSEAFFLMILHYIFMAIQTVHLKFIP